MRVLELDPGIFNVSSSTYWRAEAAAGTNTAWTNTLNELRTVPGGAS